MTNNPIIFSSFIHSDLKEKMDRFHSIYKAMDQSTNGNIISFLMDDNGEIIGYNLHGNKLNSLFFGPSHPCVWHFENKDVVSVEHLPDGRVIRRLFRRLHPRKKCDRFLTAILNGTSISEKSINYYTASLYDKNRKWMQIEIIFRIFSAVSLLIYKNKLIFTQLLTDRITGHQNQIT